jgi:hypothetical protein
MTSYFLDFGWGCDYEVSCGSLDSMVTDYTVGRPGFECRGLRWGSSVDIVTIIYSYLLLYIDEYYAM